MLNLFISLFKGRGDIFAIRWEKDGRCGYAPSYKFEWKEYLTHKAKGGNFQNFQNKEKIPLTKEIIRSHLLGLSLIVVYLCWKTICYTLLLLILMRKIGKLISEILQESLKKILYLKNCKKVQEILAWASLFNDGRLKRNICIYKIYLI